MQFDLTRHLLNLIKIKIELESNYGGTGVTLRIGVAGKYCKVTERLLWNDKALLGNKQNLAPEFCAVAGDLSDLQRA